MKQNRALQQSTATTTVAAGISGFARGDTCVDVEGLCSAYLGVAVGALGSEERSAYAYAEFLCRVGALAYARSYTAFSAGIQLDVGTQMGNNNIRSIELQSNLNAASSTFVFTGAAAGASVAAETAAYIYTDDSTFCNSASNDLSDDEIGLLRTCPSFAYGSAGAEAQASSFSSSLAQSFSSANTHNFVKVEGRDIEQFQAFTIAGVSAFASSDSISASSAYARAWASAVAGAESDSTVCQDWYTAHCEAYGNDDSFCKQSDHEVCSQIFAFAGANSDAFAEAFAIAGTSATANIELTFFMYLAVKGGSQGNDGFSGFLHAGVDIETEPDYLPVGFRSTCRN